MRKPVVRHTYDSVACCRAKCEAAGVHPDDIKQLADLAIEKLIRGNHSVAMIAEMLGYSESRAFTRAFKQWTGMSPVHYRDHFQTQFYGEGGAKRN